jgi:hypothetical protein
MAKKKKSTHGGAGRGQGRHLKYGEETKNVTFRCPVSKIEQLKKLVNDALAGWSQGSS